MNKEERILKYINTADELTFSGKRYYENDFYNDVENLVKENQELKDRINKASDLLKLLHYQFPDYDDIHNRIEDIERILKEDNKEEK